MLLLLLLLLAGLSGVLGGLLLAVLLLLWWRRTGAGRWVVRHAAVAVGALVALPGLGLLLGGRWSVRVLARSLAEAVCRQLLVLV